MACSESEKGPKGKGGGTANPPSPPEPSPLAAAYVASPELLYKISQYN
jgi:hypothetical protein